jgi:hypothetical protein
MPTLLRVAAYLAIAADAQHQGDDAAVHARNHGASQTDLDQAGDRSN